MGNTVWVYQYDIAALVYLTVLFFLIWHYKNIATESNKAFKQILWTAIFTTIFDLLGVLVLEKSEIIPLSLNYAVQMLYMLFLFGCGLSYYHLIYLMVRPFRKESKARKIAITVISAIDVLLILSTPVTKLVFFLEPRADGAPGYTYNHGPALYALYGIAFSLIILCLYDTVHYHRLLTVAQQRTVYSWTLATIVGMVIQIIFPGVNMTCFAISISTLLAFFTLQNPNDHIDPVTGMNNSLGFKHLLNSFFQRGDKATFVCIKYTNFDYAGSILGEAALDTVAVSLGKRLQSLITKQVIFRIGKERFVICLPHKPENLNDFVGKVISASNVPINIDGAELKFSPVVCVIHAPESVAYAEDVPDTIEYALQEAEAKVGVSTFYEVAESALIRKHRDSAITHILRRAVTNEEFKLAFQPVYSTHDNSIVWAEAFARLEDNTLGRINPSEFIPIAEQNGMIIRLGQIVLDTVCRFIANDLSNCNPLSYISINLSPIQCLQPDFAEQVMTTIRKYGIDPSMIAFEITPDSAKHSIETLIPNMKRLSEMGITFLIDRYTVNLSSVSVLSTLPFKGVKLSHETIIAAYHNNEMLTALKNVIKTFKTASMRVVATGIESRELSEAYTVLGCDYLQGFHLSLPLSADEFIDKLSKDSDR